MKVLAAGDLHVGAGASYADDRLADQEAVLDQIVELAESVDLVVLPGDIFHRPKPTPAELHLFSRFARRLRSAGKPVVACLGNSGHDQTGFGQLAALELFDDKMFFVSRHPEVVLDFLTLTGIAVATLPSVPVSRLVAAQNGGDRGEIYQNAVDLLLRTAEELRAAIEPGWASLLIGHWSLSGACLPNGMSSDDLNEPVLPIDFIAELGFDAAIFGHLHRYQVLSDDPFIAYTGSPMTHDFGESNIEHGCLIVEWAA